MHRCLGLVLLLFFAACRAQSPPVAEAPDAEKPDAETPVDKASDAETPRAQRNGWQRYPLPSQRFSAEYPGLPTPVGFGGDAGSETMMFVDQKGTWVVHAADVAEEQRSLSAEQILDHFRDHRLVMEMADGTKAPVLVDEPVKSGEVAGRKFVFHAHDNNLSYSRVYVFEGATFQATVVANRELADDPDIEYFFDSIQFHPGAKADLDGPYQSPDGRFEIAFSRLPLVHYPPPNREHGAVAEARYRGECNGMSCNIMYVKYDEGPSDVEEFIAGFGPKVAELYEQELVRDLPFEIDEGFARDIVLKSPLGHTRTLMVMSGPEQFKIDIQDPSSEAVTSKEVDALFSSFRLLQPKSTEGDAAEGPVPQ